MEIILKNKYCQLELTTQGAIVYSCIFFGKYGEFSPLYKASWYGSSKSGSGLIDYLAGEFVCVPFGMDRDPNTLHPDWRGTITKNNDFPHGYAAHHQWTVIQKKDDFVELQINYPKTSDIEYLKRKIFLDKNRAKIHFELEIKTINTVSIPIGLHPIFDTNNHEIEISVDFEYACTFPGEVEPNKSIFTENKIFSSLKQVPLRGGGYMAIDQLPLSHNTEELIQLCGCNGEVFLLFDKKNEIKLEWDQTILPSCLLWISNRGRDYSPWNNRNLCLGVEPICSAFDMGNSISLGKNPISDLGTVTTQTILANKPILIKYSLEYQEK